MTLEERKLAVAILLTLTIAVRIVAARAAGGVFRNQDDGLAREGNRVFAAALRLAALVTFTAVFAWSILPIELPGSIPIPKALGPLGVLLTQAGLALLISVHLALGVHFSGTLHLRPDHHLVRSGPYRRIRHPMYTSFLLLFAGLSILVGNVLAAAVMFGSQVWTLVYRLPKEERSLHRRFGDAWLEYRSQTGALTPWW